MKQETYQQAIGRYMIGSIGAAGLTVLAYLTVTQRWTTSMAVIAAIVLVLALIQFVVQLLTFLHFGAEKAPRWRTYSLLFTVIMASVIVSGSIWIMINLNYRMNMSPQAMYQYMLNQNKKGF